jgi:hypothetical protein
LVTADCGAAGNEAGEDQGMARLMFAEIVAVARVTPRGASAVLKAYMPTTVQSIVCVQALAVLASLFRSVSAHKPVVNEYSPEVYLVCESKRRDLTAREWAHFQEALAGFDPDVPAMPSSAFDGRYPDVCPWLQSVVEEVYEINTFNLHRVFFYWDLVVFRPGVMQAHLPLLNRRRAEKCVEWTELVRFAPEAGATPRGAPKRKARRGRK